MFSLLNQTSGQCLCTFMQLFMPYLNFEYTKAVISTVENVGGGIGQGPATEVTHVGLNQPPFFSSDMCTC